MCSSTKNDNVPDLFRYELHKDIYNIKKDTYACCDCIYKLDKEQFIKKIDIISDNDYNNIYKSLYLINKKYKKIKMYDKLAYSLVYNIGDIVNYDNRLFYIHNIDDNYFYTYLVMESKKGKYVLKVNDVFLAFDFFTNKKIKINSPMNLVNILDNNIQNRIKIEVLKVSKKVKEGSELSRGKLVTLQNNYYYIYGEFQDKLLVYKIYLDKDCNSKMSKIIIGGGIYYTLFEEDKISRNLDITIRRVALEKEMKRIKIMKKNYLHKKK